MSNAIITVRNLSKRYLVGHRSIRRERYPTLRDALVREARNFARKAVDIAHGRQIIQGDEVEEFWALRDLNFEVHQGEVLGIVGPNGAGKSTLLKILSRITEPSEGRIMIRGRVSSLLEVGTGFNQELTGRENIFLNGAILGMTRTEVRRKFDEIVAFADVEKFIDTPVKRYSSGMYVRLAFAVAAHLEPEILIVDEVLAVGDAEFQKKCLGKMNEVAHQKARTVLFVSHRMETIIKICNRVMLLRGGQIQTIGNAEVVVTDYLRSELSSVEVIDLRPMFRDHDLQGKYRLVQLAPFPARSRWSFSFGEDIGFDLAIEAKAPLDPATITIALLSARGFEVATWSNPCAGVHLSLSTGLNRFRFVFRHIHLLPGQFSINVGLKSPRGFEDHVPNAVTFDIHPSDQSSQISSHEFRGTLIPDIEVLPVG